MSHDCRISVLEVDLDSSHQVNDGGRRQKARTISIKQRIHIFNFGAKHWNIVQKMIKISNICKVDLDSMVKGKKCYPIWPFWIVNTIMKPNLNQKIILKDYHSQSCDCPISILMADINPFLCPHHFCVGTYCCHPCLCVCLCHFCLKPWYMKNAWVFWNKTDRVGALWQLLSLIRFWAWRDPQGPGPRGGAWIFFLIFI